MRLRSARIARLAPTIALTALVVGCSTVEDPSTTTATTVPTWSTAADAETWLALDRICSDANDELAAIADDMLPLDSTPLSPADVAAYRRRSTEVLRRALDSLRDAVPPAAIADDWQDTLDGLADWAEWSDDLASVLDSVPDTLPDPLGANSTVDQTADAGLEEFRSLFENASCSQFLDVN